MKFVPTKRDNGICCGESPSEDKEAKLPCSDIAVPKGMAGVKLGEMVTISITGKVKGFREDSWDDTSRIELELHEADVSSKKDGDEFAAMVDDD